MTDFTLGEILSRGHPVWAEVDLAAIRHNIRTLAALAPEAEVMGVVKGYAYGHGNPQSAVAMLEAGATRLGVARVPEALHLREAGIDVPIHVFSEPPADAAGTLIEHDLIPTVFSQKFAQALATAAEERGVTARAHVKLDTGMHRVGVPADEVESAAKILLGLRSVDLEGVWSHFAVADQPAHPFNREQLNLFGKLVEKMEGAGLSFRMKHMANSAAALSFPEAHLDMLRCGIASYGLWPGDELVGSADLRPAMALKARVTMSKEVRAGDALSYGLRYRLPEDSNVVTIAGGYADGYDRRLSGRADLLLNGKRFRVSGTVCMDQFMVDVGREEIEAGATATLLGHDGSEHVSAEELASLVGTINYEITCRIPSRVPRVFIEGDAS